MQPLTRSVESMKLFVLAVFWSVFAHCLPLWNTPLPQDALMRLLSGVLWLSNLEFVHDEADRNGETYVVGVAHFYLLSSIICASWSLCMMRLTSKQQDIHGGCCPHLLVIHYNLLPGIL
eukprot:1161865-Pelagomonas_calceolata.AAC.1